MKKPVDPGEYVRNLRTLLAADEARFGLMLERQIRGVLLPRLRGNRSQLEPPLWDLLTLCMHGHQHPAGPLDDDQWLRVSDQMAATEATWRYPRAATAVFETLQTLRHAGTLPAPVGA